MGFYASLPLLAGVMGDLLGGTVSDLWAKRTGQLRLARRGVATTGFFLAALGVVLAVYAENSVVSVAYSCIAVFGLELTVGVSWAVTLDVGGDFAGSVSAVMNTCGNIGGAIAAAVSAYLAEAYGWNAPFLVVAGLCVLAGLLFLGIDAGTTFFAGGSRPHVHSGSTAASVPQEAGS
jgi:sugar phosphate permease